MKRVEAILIVRGLIVVAIFPALAGCAIDGAGEPLTRGDVARGDVPDATRAPAWAAPDEAIVRPGVVIRTQLRDCLSNFVFTRADNGAVFLGTTAYCTRDLAIGSVAAIGDEQTLGVLVYHSGQTMDEIGETDPDAREYNDFAVYYLHRENAHKVSPALPVVGGPSGPADGGAAQLGDVLRAFARAPELPRETDWREGVVSGRAGDWALLTHNALPVAPGTTGGGVIDSEGRAVGVVVTLGVMPNPGANGVARLDALMAYARAHGQLPMELATA